VALGALALLVWQGPVVPAPPGALAPREMAELAVPQATHVRAWEGEDEQKKAEGGSGLEGKGGDMGMPALGGPPPPAGIGNTTTPPPQPTAPPGAAPAPKMPERATDDKKADRPEPKAYRGRMALRKATGGLKDGKGLKQYDRDAKARTGVVGKPGEKR